jgi:hypothetical protein
VFGLRWSARAIRSYAMAELEVRKIKYPKVGTESLLMGILIEGLLQSLIGFILLSIIIAKCFFLLA